jgi:hypothetical protein
MIDQWHLQRCLREFENHINQLTREVNSLRQFQESTVQEKQVKAVLEVLIRAQTGQMAYTNLIIVAGYAGFLTFWSSLKNDLPPLLYAVAGLLIVLSLICFISWETTKMILSAIHLRKSEMQLTSSGMSGVDIITKLQQDNNIFDRRVYKLWLRFLIPTIAFGLSSSLCLVGFFIYKIGSMFWPQT